VKSEGAGRKEKRGGPGRTSDVIKLLGLVPAFFLLAFCILVLPGIELHPDHDRVNYCHSQLSSVAYALDGYYEKNGRYPENTDPHRSLRATLSDANDSVADEYAVDPWGQDFFYISHGENQYILGSGGSNQKIDMFTELIRLSKDEAWLPISHTSDDILIMEEYVGDWRSERARLRQERQMQPQPP